MHLLTDQDVYQVTVGQLREWGHDVMTAKELGMQRALDDFYQATLADWKLAHRA